MSVTPHSQSCLAHIVKPFLRPREISTFASTQVALTRLTGSDYYKYFVNITFSKGTNHCLSRQKDALTYNLQVRKEVQTLN